MFDAVEPLCGPAAGALRGRSGHCDVGRSLYHFVRELGVACNLADANAEVQGCAARASARGRSGTIPRPFRTQEAEFKNPKSKEAEVEIGASKIREARRNAGDMHRRDRRPTTTFAATIKNGVVPKNQIESLKPYLGDYEGQWNSSVTDDLSDGISRYKLENPVMRLSLDAQNQLRVQFYFDAASAQLNDELDLLGFGCHSKVGDLLELDTTKPPKGHAAEPYQVFAARFDFDWGNCPARVYAVPSNDLEFALLVDPNDRQYVVQLRLLKRVQADGKIVME